MREAIGKSLKICREKSKKTINEVAADFNLNKETIRRYEKNASGLSIERLESFITYYKIEEPIFFNLVSANMHILDDV